VLERQTMTEVTAGKSKFPFKWLALGCGIVFVILIIIPVAVFTSIIRPLFITIEPDEVAVLISPYEPGGYRAEPLRPGNHMLRPLEAIERYKVVRETYDSSSSDCNCGSSGAVSLNAGDNVDVLINYHVTYAIDPDQALKLYMEWRHDYQRHFVVPRLMEVIEEIAGQYTSNEISLTKKEQIEKEVYSRLEEEFPKACLILLGFKIDDVRLK
jgi:regulator of protease activity HflC (stomatin/prohibitin superfamily)